MDSFSILCTWGGVRFWTWQVHLPPWVLWASDAENRALSTQGSLEFVWWWVKWIEIPWGWRIWGRAEASDLTLPWNSGLAFYSGSFLLDGLLTEGFPGGSDGKESACKAGDTGLIPGSGRSLGEGNGRPLQISCLENPMDRGTWLQSMGSQRVGQDRVTNTFTFFPLAEQ